MAYAKPVTIWRACSFLVQVMTGVRLGGVSATFASIASTPATGAGRFTLEVSRCKDIL